MSQKENKQLKKYMERKEENSPIKTNNFKNKKQIKNKENGTAYMTYKLDKNLFKDDKYIELFGENFVKENKNKCKIIINGKEYDIISMINFEEFEKYEINKEDETLKILLKNEKIEDMSSMFENCKSLIKVDLSSFNSQNIIDMSDMFGGCKSLIKVDLSSFNTKNVTNMSGMFAGCKNLIKADLSSFNTENVTNMSFMFSNCVNSIKVDLSSFNIQNITNLSIMFWYCNSLIKINRKNLSKIKRKLKLSKLLIIEI